MGTLDTDMVDMRCLVIVGSSRTRLSKRADGSNRGVDTPRLPRMIVLAWPDRPIQPGQRLGHGRYHCRSGDRRGTINDDHRQAQPARGTSFAAV